MFGIMHGSANASALCALFVFQVVLAELSAPLVKFLVIC